MYCVDFTEKRFVRLFWHHLLMLGFLFFPKRHTMTMFYLYVKSWLYAIYDMHVGNRRHIYTLAQYCDERLEIGLLEVYDTFTPVVASQTGTKPNYTCTTYANDQTD
jgi:hypothetical protein